jgi:hypothetical protein
MPDVDSVMIKSYLHSLHESNPVRSDRIDCKISSNPHYSSSDDAHSSLHRRNTRFSPDSSREVPLDCKIYVSNLPLTHLQEFLETLSAAMRAQRMLIQENDPVRSAWQGKDNFYIFIELFNVEEANNCLLFNGMTYKNQEFKSAQELHRNSADVVD